MKISTAGSEQIHNEHGRATGHTNSVHLMRDYRFWPNQPVNCKRNT